MAKRIRDDDDGQQASSSNVSRLDLEDDDLSDHDIEIDHLPILTERQREFADQFLNNDFVEQTLPEDYVEPHEKLKWLESDEDLEYEEEQEEEDQEEDQEEVQNEEDNNFDGESTQDLLEIVYGEHIIDPFAEYNIKPNSKFPDWINALIKARHWDTNLIKEEFYKGYELEKHTAFSDKWPGLKKYTIIIDNGSTRKDLLSKAQCSLSQLQLIKYINFLINS